MRTLSEQEYVLFQAAKGIWQSQRTITIPELCDRKLVEDKTLELILNAALIAHYGRAMLAFDRLEGQSMMQMALSNAVHPEYGVVTIPFPIPEEEYGHCLELLEALEIGNAVNRDCKVQEVQDGPPILKRLEGSRVNLDELDYLAKRLDSFTDQELAQFQSAAVSYDYSNIVDLINLTFSCQEVTVITDFSDLESIGRNHYMTLNAEAPEWRNWTTWTGLKPPCS